MRNHKNNIIFNARNITLILKNITPYFTGKVKIITLVSIIIMLSFTNIINTSALSYSSSVGVGFTFNPTLSVSISPSDLIISNLVPGSTLDSNVINVSVATNASYGYTLSVSASNENLVHSNNTDTFSGIATDANLASLTTDNTWGHSTSLDNGTTWGNYNGLSSSTSSTLLDKDSNASSSVDFKIGAKASSTQASGTYTNTITFTAVTKPTPMNLAESYFAAGKTRHNGYYTMQDMTTEICTNTEVIGESSQTQLIDIRDDKVYWATKLADNHCWMTQNLNLAGGTQLSSDTTDFDNFYNIPDTQGWQANGTLPESNTSGFNTNNYAYVYNSNSEICDDNNPCYSYYSWDAATLGSGRNITNENTNAQYSICPKNWQLPSSNNFENLIITYDPESNFYDNAGPNTIPNFLLSGRFYRNVFYNQYGFYWSSTRIDNSISKDLKFDKSIVDYSDNSNNRNGMAIRCLAR